MAKCYTLESPKHFTDPKLTPKSKTINSILDFSKAYSVVKGKGKPIGMILN